MENLERTLYACGPLYVGSGLSLVLVLVLGLGPGLGLRWGLRWGLGPLGKHANRKLRVTLSVTPQVNLSPTLIVTPKVTPRLTLGVTPKVK